MKGVVYLIFGKLFRGKDDSLLDGQIAPESLTGLTNFIEYAWNQYYSSPQYMRYGVCQEYWKNKNPGVQCKQRLIYERDKTGQVVCRESEILSNIKISHGYYKKLVNQKVGFVLTDMFKIVPKNRNETKWEDMKARLEEYLTDKMHRTIKNSAAQCISKGVDWIRCYYDETNDIKFTRVPAEQVYPIWRDNDQTELDAIIHCYSVEAWETDRLVATQHYDYYHQDFVARFVQDSTTKAIVPYDLTGTFIEPYFWSSTDQFNNTELDSVTATSIGKLPWICLRYESDFAPLLDRIETTLDQIDRKTSELSDFISDHPNSILVVQNADMTDQEEFLTNMNNLRLMFVDGDGGVDSLEVPLNINDTITFLNHLNSKMYEQANGIDTASKDTRDTSATALKILFGDLDQDVKHWEIELRESLRDIIYFILTDIYRKYGEDYFDVDYDIVFTHSSITNDTEMIQNILTSTGITSNETNFAYHPFVQDVQYELGRILREKKEEMELELEQAEKESSFGSVSTENINTNSTYSTDNTLVRGEGSSS